MHGGIRPEQLEIVRFRRKLAKLKVKCDVLKDAAVYFAKHRGLWPVTWMCWASMDREAGFILGSPGPRRSVPATTR